MIRLTLTGSPHFEHRISTVSVGSISCESLRCSGYNSAADVATTRGDGPEVLKAAVMGVDNHEGMTSLLYGSQRTG